MIKPVSPWRELKANIEARLAESAPSPSKQLSGSLPGLMSRWHPTSGSILVCVGVRQRENTLQLTLKHWASVGLACLAVCLRWSN